MAYEASQKGLRGLIEADDIYHVADTPNRMGIKFQPKNGDMFQESWLRTLLIDIKKGSHVFSAYPRGRVRFEDYGGNYGDHSFQELRRVKDTEAWARETAQKYANGAVEFVVYNGESIPAADAWFVFSSGEKNGIVLWVTTTMDASQEKPTQEDRQRVRQLVKPFLPKEQLNDIVARLFKKFE